MRIPSLSAALVALALTASTSLPAAASPPIVTTPIRATPEASPGPAAADAAGYAAREATDTAVGEFRGGAEVLVIGGTTVGLIVLLVVLVVIL